MHTILIEKFRSYLVHNSPDIMIRLQHEFLLTQYLEDKVLNVMPLAEQLIAENKPQYIIEELCMEELTRNIRPSRFMYIRGLLEEEFLQTYERFREMGVLTYETINLIDACKPVFDHIGFTEDNEDDRQLRYAITGAIAEYLEKN